LEKKVNKAVATFKTDDDNGVLTETVLQSEDPINVYTVEGTFHISCVRDGETVPPLAFVPSHSLLYLVVESDAPVSVQGGAIA
jgi:hypothetical protein